MKKTLLQGALAAAAVAGFAASSGAVAAENFNRTIQAGQVNINRTVQCGEANVNTTSQEGRVNINQTIQSCGSRAPGSRRSDPPANRPVPGLTGGAASSQSPGLLRRGPHR